MIEDSIAMYEYFKPSNSPTKHVKLLADFKMDFLGLTVVLKGRSVLWDPFSLNFVNYGLSSVPTTLYFSNLPSIIKEI